MNHRFVLCVNNQGYEVSLETRKIYERLPDKEAEHHNQLRIIDESGDNYIYPAEFFAPVKLPMQTRKKILKKSRVR